MIGISWDACGGAGGIGEKGGRRSPRHLLVVLGLALYLHLSLTTSAADAMEASLSSVPYEPSSTAEGPNVSAASLLHAVDKADATLSDVQDSKGSTFVFLERTLGQLDKGLVEGQNQDTASASTTTTIAAAAATTTGAGDGAQLEASGGGRAGAAAASASGLSLPSGGSSVASLGRRWLGAAIFAVLVGFALARAFGGKPTGERKRHIEDKTERALLHALDRVEELIPLLRPAQDLAEQLRSPEASKALEDLEQSITEAKEIHSEYYQHRLASGPALDRLGPALSSATGAARQLQRMARVEAAQVVEDMEKAAAALEPLSDFVLEMIDATIGPDYASALNQYLDCLKGIVEDLMQRSQEVNCRVSGSSRLLTAAADLRFVEAAASHMIFAIKQWREAVEDATGITRNIAVRCVAAKSRATAVVFNAQQGALLEASKQLAAQEAAAGEEADESKEQRQKTRHAIERSMEVLDKAHKLLREQKANLEALQTKTYLGDLLVGFQASEVAIVSVEDFISTNLSRLRSLPLLRDQFYLHLGESFKRRATETKNRAVATKRLVDLLSNAMHEELGGLATRSPPPKFVNQKIFKAFIEAAEASSDRAHKLEKETANLAHAMNSGPDGKRLSDLVSLGNSQASLVEDLASDTERLWLKGRLVLALERDMRETARMARHAASKKGAPKDELATLRKDFNKAGLDAGGATNAHQIAEAAARMRLAAHYMFLLTSGVELMAQNTDQE
ncbi:hypothetical protein ACSSS7_006937 [Eimeria intestinalis]